MKNSELIELCKDRELVTNEIQISNDYYGHAAVIKKFCGIPAHYPIKASIEHAPTLGNFVWGADAHIALPTIFTFSRDRYSIIRKYSDKGLFAIGSPILYAESILSQQQRMQELCRLGRCLLVFPTHSSHFLEVQYDIKNYCERIETLAKNFDSVRICVYWKDVLNGVAETYESFGFECVSAGHMFDPLFLPRLRSIIECASVATGAEGGTSIGYCVALGCPFFFTPTNYSYKAADQIIQEEVNKELDLSRIFYDKVEQTFGNSLKTETTGEERQLVDTLWGTKYQRTQEELLHIIEICEDLYQIALETGFHNFNYIFHKLDDYLAAGEYKKLLLATEEAQQSDPAQAAALTVLRAAANLQLGKASDAAHQLEEYLSTNPANESAINLLKLCQSGTKLF